MCRYLECADIRHRRTFSRFTFSRFLGLHDSDKTTDDRNTSSGFFDVSSRLVSSKAVLILGVEIHADMQTS